MARGVTGILTLLHKKVKGSGILRMASAAAAKKWQRVPAL
jgi:hypothetical protein